MFLTFIRQFGMSFLLMLWASSLMAVELPEIAGNRIDDRNFIRNEQQRLIEEQQRKLEQLEQLPGKRASEAVPSSTDEGACFPISAIDLEGNTLISPEQQGAITDGFINKCLTAANLNELLRRFTELYVDKGYVTTRAYLPQQDLSQRRLRVVVVEGYIETIKSRTETLANREIAWAAPIQQGDALNLRDLEQLIDQLNRLPSNQATLQLEPGEDVGGSQVLISNEAKRPVRFMVGRNNDGSEGSGEQQWTASAEWDNPLGIADQLVAQWGQDASGRESIGSGNTYLAYSVPRGYWTLSYQYAQSDYHSLAEANGFTFSLRGESERHQAELERVIQRDGISKSAVNLGISRLSTRNYIDGARIEVSSQRLSELSLEINHGRRIQKAFLNFDLGWHKGITVFGVQHDENDSESAPTTRFEKTTLALSYLHPFVLLNETLSFSSLVNAQWSNDVLFSPQRISVGGQSSVRGFKEQAISGDSGAYWRNQIAWKYPLNFFNPLFDTLETHIAYDVGVIHHGEHNPQIHGRMSGYAFGLGMHGNHLSADIVLSNSLEKPDFLTDESPVYFSVGLRY